MRVAEARVIDSSTGGSPADASSMVLDLELGQRYQHSLGFSSPFFIGLAERKLLATSCPTCGATYFPPKERCRRDGGRTRWYELTGTGRVVAATVVHSPPPFGGVDEPYVLASIRLDGVDGGLTHRVIGPAAPEAGRTVSVRFLDGPHAHPLLAIAFAVDPPHESDEVHQ